MLPVFSGVQAAHLLFLLSIYYFSYCESSNVRWVPMWFSWVGQTKKFGSQRIVDFHWWVYWKFQNHKFKIPQTCVPSLIHENWYPQIKVLSQYFMFFVVYVCFSCLVFIPGVREHHFLFSSFVRKASVYRLQQHHFIGQSQKESWRTKTHWQVLKS